MELYDFQALNKDQIREQFKHGRAVLYQAGTGSGKTVVATDIMKGVRDNFQYAWFVAHRRELIEQTHRTLYDWGIDSGIIMAGHKLNTHLPIQVCSIGTLNERIIKRDKLKITRPPKLIIIDECFPPEVEILTENGFVRFDELEDEAVAQYESGRVSFIRPTRKIKHRYTGEMIRLKSERLIDMPMTPNHELLIRYNGSDRKVRVEGVKFFYSKDMYVAGAAGSDPGQALTPKEKLAIVFQADGNRHSKNTMMFSFAKQRKIDLFLELMEEGGFKHKLIDRRTNKWNSTRSRWCVYDMPNVSRLITESLPVNLTVEKAREVIEYMVHWDGHVYSCGLYYYSSTIESNVDYYQAVAVLCGYKTNKTIQVDNRSEKFRDVYRLHINKDTDTIGTQAIKKETYLYNGNVHCVEVPSGNIIVRHGGKVLVTGNCHRSLSKSYLSLMDMFPEAYILGLTATPIRSDGRGLGHVYDNMVQSPSVAELILQGYLVQPRYFTGATADLKGVGTHDYDYARGELEARVNNADLRGDVVEQWLRHGEGRKTFVFASGVKHSIALKDDFLAAGVSAVHVDAHTHLDERDQIMHDFRNTDKYQVICNCMIYTEGTDVPEVGCVSLACPTKIISKYLQMAGRCLRPHKPTNKNDCIILDHAGCIERHGFVEDPVPWSLDKDGRLKQRMPAARDHLVREFVCTMCGCVFSGRINCPECGTRLEIQGQHELISTVEELIEVTRGAVGAKAADKQKTYTKEQKQNFHSQLLRYAEGENPRAKKYGHGWISHTYRAKFGVWPQGMTGEVAAEVSKEVKAFIRAKNAAYHIRRNYRDKQQAAG